MLIKRNLVYFSDVFAVIRSHPVGEVTCHIRPILTRTAAVQGCACTAGIVRNDICKTLILQAGIQRSLTQTGMADDCRSVHVQFRKRCRVIQTLGRAPCPDCQMRKRRIAVLVVREQIFVDAHCIIGIREMLLHVPVHAERLVAEGDKAKAAVDDLFHRKTAGRHVVTSADQHEKRGFSDILRCKALYLEHIAFLAEMRGNFRSAIVAVAACKRKA